MNRPLASNTLRFPKKKQKPLIPKKVGLYIQLNGLQKIHYFTNPNAFLVLQKRRFHINQWDDAFRTNPVMSCFNPYFNEQIQLDYVPVPEQFHRFKVQVFHLSSTKSNSLSSQTFLGEAVFTIEDLMKNELSPMTLELRNPGSWSTIVGTVTIWGEEQTNLCKDKIQMQIGSRGFQEETFSFYRHSMRLRISRWHQNIWVPVWMTEALQSSQDWQLIPLPLQKLGKNPKECLLKLECLHHCDGTCYGFYEAHLESMLKLIGTWIPLQCQHPKNSKNNNDENIVDAITTNTTSENNHNSTTKLWTTKGGGELLIQEATFSRHDTFYDYVCGGCDMNIMVAIDFRPMDIGTTSGATNFSQCEKSIGMVDTFAKKYSNRKEFKVYGFGGGGPQHKVFNVSFCDATLGIEGTIEACKLFQTIAKRDEPTCLAPLVNTITKMITKENCTQSNQRYHVLFIITDGQIDDMKNSVDAVVEASSLPLSIVIIGVGSGDFRKMIHLDGDDAMLVSHSSIFADRDIVQFIPFNLIQEDDDYFEQQILEEIPEQFVAFMQRQNIVPNLPIDTVEQRAMYA